MVPATVAALYSARPLIGRKAAMANTVFCHYRVAPGNESDFEGMKFPHLVPLDV